jgi:hypothetical protein
MAERKWTSANARHFLVAPGQTVKEASIAAT